MSDHHPANPPQTTMTNASIHATAGTHRRSLVAGFSKMGMRHAKNFLVHFAYVVTGRSLRRRWGGLLLGDMACYLLHCLTAARERSSDPRATLKPQTYLPREFARH